ncbi:MAG: putative DNA binding domain-containing protein [Oscillospiraceae bacterium]|nr:putative DNA binding domain-containing protein [Oscillospiraceae bacterium]
MIDFEKLNTYRENNRLELKMAAGGLPNSIWETYSALANTDGGVILLGVEEKPGKTLNVIKLENPEKLISDFWNTINNPKKVNLNLLNDNRVNIIEVEGKRIITIEVPRAERTDKPIFIGENPFMGTFRRNGEGDYHCREEEINAMYRDKSVKTQDMLVLENMDNSVFNYDSVKAYRNRLMLTRPDHVWEELSHDEFLYKLGAIGVGEDKKRHPTAAGLLMFGNDYEIVHEYGNYFLDYQEQFDVDTRWTDRVNSSTGEWSGNVCDFYFKVMNRLSQTLKVPFKLVGDTRIDDTPVHKAVREAFVNCLVNADYYGRCGLVIKRKLNEITFENPGGFRVSIDLAISGGVSDPRNSVLMKMFNFLNIGERAGSGIPNIFNVWDKENLGVPQYEEILDGSRTKLTLPIEYASDKTKTSDNRAIKTSDKGKLILNIMENGVKYKTNDIADAIDLSPARTRVYLKEMAEAGTLKSDGANKSKVYYLPGKGN